MTRLAKRSFLQLAGGCTLAALAVLAGCSKKDEAGPAAASAPAMVPASAAMAAAPPATAASGPLKIAFAYVGPVGDGGWTFAHDNARKALEQEFGSRIQTSFVEKVPEAADAERVFRDMASQGNQLIFGTTFGYMEPMLKTAADLKDVEVRARHRVQAGGQHAHLRQPHLRRRLHGRHHRRRHDQEQRSRRRGLGADPRGRPQHRQLHDGRAIGQPEDQDQGGLGQRVVQPAQGDRGGPSRSSTAAPTC